MSNETIGLTVDIDGSIAKGKAKVDELAAYARRQLGGAMFSGKQGGSGGFSQGFTSEFEKVKRESKSAFDSVVNEAKKMREKLSASIASGVSLDPLGIKNLQRSIESLRTSFGQTYKASSAGAKDASRDVESFRRQINALERDMNRLSSAQKANAFQRYGMFNNRGISPLFTAQQIVEDYSYAGMRGAANNIAFLLAELAPAGGIGAKLAGGGILALMAYQFYEMGKAMEWWGNKADDAAEKAKRMKSAIESASQAAGGVISAMATAQSNLLSGGLGIPLGPRASGYADMRRQAMLRVMSNPTGINALRGAISSNPAAFPYGSVGASLGKSEQARSEEQRMVSIQRAMNVAQVASGNLPSNFATGTWLRWLKDSGVGSVISATNPVFPAVALGYRGAQIAGVPGTKPAVSPQEQQAARDEIRNILGAMPGGTQLTGLIDSSLPGEIDFTQISKVLQGEYDKAKAKVIELKSEHEQAMKEMKESSGAVAAEVLNIAQSNNRAADSVENVIKSNEALNEAYQRQMSLLRNLEILKERDQFRSSAFGLMRSKGAQFMEEAGLPQWMIEQRNMALYERQAGLLFSSSQAAGAAGDTRGQIEYLKQIQQLQFEVIGNTNNRAVAESVMERAIRVQHEIESLIRLNQQQGQAEYEMVQKMTMGLVEMRDIINAMPPIRLGALQQAGEVAQLNAQLVALRNNTATVQPPTGVAASVAKFGEMPLPGFNRGGHIPGYGGGDKVPALLEKGEFVVNKDAVRALGVDALYDLNSSGVRKFARGGWSGTGYSMVHSSYPGSRRRLQRLRAGQSWYRDYRGESASVWARRGVREHREAEYAANQSERAWMAMGGRAPGQISNWGGYGDTGIVASLGEPSVSNSGSVYSTNSSSTRSVKQWMPSPVRMSGSAPMTGAYPGVHLRRVGNSTFGSFSSDPYSGTGYGQTIGADGYYIGSHQAFSDLISYPMRARIRDNGGTVMRAAPNGTFSWNGIEHFSQRDFVAHMRQRNGGMLNVNWGRTLTLPGGREVNTQYGQTGQGWMQMRMAQRQATANIMSERARQAQAVSSASKLRYARQAQAISNAGANRRAVGAFFASRNGMSPQQVAAMRASRFSGGRWGSNFAAYTGQLFGPGFSPYMGGGFGGYGMPVAPMARSYGLWDSGPALMGLRAFARGGYVSSQGGRLIASGPDIFQGDTEFEYMGGYPAMGPDFNYMNYQSFMDQRRRVLAGSLNAAYGGPTDMAGNTLGSFGTFSDGSLRSRYSGGFSTVNQHQGFGSSMRGMGFSSFRRPIGAMTGGYITTAGNVARFANGGYVGKSSGTSISNNFGSIRIEVKSPKDAVDTSYQLRRTRSSYWAQKG